MPSMTMRASDLPSQRGETWNDTEAINRHRPSQRLALAIKVSRAALRECLTPTSSPRSTPSSTRCSSSDDAAASALFVEDDEILMAGSEETEHAVGRDAVAALHRQIAGSPTRFAFTWRRRSAHVHGDVAWVNADGTVRVERGVNASTLPYRVTAVLVCRDGEWRRHTFNGSQPHPS
jgi:hypothetical protein